MTTTDVTPEGQVGSPADRLVAAQQALAGTPVGAVLDGFVDALEHVPGHGEWAVVEPRAARTLLAGLYAAEQRLRGLVDAGIAAAETEGWIDEVGLGAPSWLHQFNAENRSACVRRVARARRVSEQPRLAEAVASGEMAPDQAAQAARVLTDLPQSVGAVESAAAAETMVQLSAEHDPRGLSGLAGYLLEVVAPERSEQLEAERLAAQEARASRERELYFSDDGHGAVRIRGKLPVVEAAQLRSAVDALAYRRRRALVEGADSMLPGVVDDAVQSWLDASGASDAGAMPMTSLARCRADALVELAHMAAAGGDLPAHGGDRPRLAVTVDQDTLRRDSGLAALADGTPVSWARARQIACDAAALPIVLDGAGVPLDVGREQRFFAGAVRLAVLQRDGGCVFPGCDRMPAGCDVHHVIPWWNGGATDLDNGVALCPHHHGLVEPRPGADQWHVQWAGDRLPEFIPPTTLDPARRPRVHARFRLRRLRARHDPDDGESE